MSLTTRQKRILEIVDAFREGWIDEINLEKRLEKLFIDGRHKPKKK
jgi:hypothetical protein